jgi:CheY-like chemotaxis protein
LGASRDPEQVAKVREMMERQLGHLVRLVDDLLDISRITLGKVQLKKERVDFRAVLHSALETTRTLVEAREHELAVRLPFDPFPLDVDPTRLAQVFANIINNAARYTSPGGRIELTAGKEGDTLVVAVSDTGVGISSEMLPRVFEMFTQVARSNEQHQEGLGVGLALARRLVEMHGGSVEAGSGGLGTGSTFTVRLPLVADRAAAAGDGSGADSARRVEDLRILVVDDNVDAAESLSMLLGLAGHETSVAHDGHAALEAAARFAPDAAFVDIGLPGMNGYEVAKRLRADPRFESLLLVALTGWGTEDDRRQAQSAGFDQHLVKPADIERIRETLRTARPRNR